MKWFVLLWIFGFLGFLYLSTTSPPSLRHTDAIIVFTGGKKRIQEGLRLLREGYSDHMFISGVHPKVKASTLSIPIGLPVTLGYNAFDTKSNALESFEWIKNNNIKSICLITDRYHIQRSLLELKRILIDVQIIPYPVSDSRPLSLSFLGYLFLEYHKYIVSLLINQAKTIEGNKGKGDTL